MRQVIGTTNEKTKHRFRIDDDKERDFYFRCGHGRSLWGGDI